jgi:hypothetical protein
MSKEFELFEFDDDKITLKEEGINFLKSIKEQIILISLISSLNDNNSANAIKISIISDLTNSNIQENLNNNIITLYESSLKKENSNEKILLLDIKSSNKHLLSLLYFASSLFIFFVEGNINEKELNKFILINSLQDTVKFDNKKDRDITFVESAPELVFFISNYNSILPKDYLEDELVKKSKDKKVNILKENIIKFFNERTCIVEEDNQKNNILMNKIIEEINPKNIKGKYFDGNSLAFFFQNFCEMHKKKGNPNFDELFRNLINNDLEIYKNEAMTYFNSEMRKLEQIENEENLIAKIYQIKIDSMEKFNFIHFLIQNLKNRPEYKDYKALYNDIKSELDTKFTEQENLKILKNLQNGELICNELLNKYYEKINEKIINRKYNENNTDEYLKDYESFLNNYKNEAKGNNKLKCLINFLEINKPQYFKCLKEGGADINNEDEEGLLNKEKEGKSKEIEEIHNKIERKKREIKNLKAEMDRIEEEIQKAQSLDEGPFNNSQSGLLTKHSK